MRKKSISIDNSLSIFLLAIKANNFCGENRKKFNFCRSNIYGKLIEPDLCHKEASELIDCFLDFEKQ